MRSLRSLRPSKLLRTRRARTGVALALIAAFLAIPAASHAVGANQANLVSPTPSTTTPNINDGNVYAILQIGTRIIVGGSFSNANPPSDTNSAHTVTRNSILAFNASTGAIDTGFVPALDGEVRSLLPGPTADTVYVGGFFNTVNGASSKSLTLLSTVTGQVVSGFHPPSTNGGVWAMQMAGGRLLIAGQFTTLGGTTHQGIGAVNPTTGAIDNAYINVQLTGHHNYNGTSGANGAVGIHEMDISPDGTRLVAVGNFKNANGVLHDQIIMIDVTSTSATLDTNWNTSGYTAACASNAYDTYMRGISFSPDGTYFVVVATGGGTTSQNTDGTRSLCDTASRWTTTTTGSNVQPVWIDYSGNDSFESVTITNDAIYTGGHFRWLNNANCSDCSGSGAVPRPGIAALDPVNGMPFTWNPGRNPRGAGAYWVYATTNGLYIGADTDSVGTGSAYYERHRIAYFPVAGGETVQTYQPAALPADIYLAGQVSGTNPDVLQKRSSFTGTTSGATTTLASTVVAWSQMRGAFMAGNTLFYGYSDGNFYQATFDGTTVGAPSLVDPYDDPVWSNVQTGSGQTYRGVKSSLYGTEMTNVRGMILTGGRLYYSVAGQSALRYRYFEPDDGVVGSIEYTAGGNVNFSNVAGMFISGDNLYYADNATGNLHSVAWNGGAPSTTTDTVVSGPTMDGNDWRARGLFGLSSPVVPPTPPTASFTSSCTDLACTFNSGASTAPGATITGYSWTFGDGGTSTVANPSHTYASGGTYSVSLTVTTSQSLSNSTTQPVTVSAGTQPISFVAGATTSANATTETVTVPASVVGGDGMLLLASGATANAPTAPSGWTLVGRSPTSLTGMTTALYRKVATGTDHGTSVAVGFGAVVHGTVQLVDYRGTSATNPVAQAVSGGVSGSATVTSPAVTVASGGQWVVTYWAAKSSTINTWTTPAGQTSRGDVNSGGSGRINSVVVDSGAPVATGAAGALTATADATPGSATTFTIVLTQ